MKLRKFLSNIQNSIYSPQFYSHAPISNWKKAFTYFYLLVLSLTIIQALFAIQPIFQDIPKQITQFVSQTVANYPSELSVNFKNGLATSNVKEPYFIPLDKNVATTSADYHNLVVIDTKTPFSASQFNDYKTAIWLTKDSVFYQDQNEVKAYTLSKVKDFTLDKGFVIYLQNKITPWISWVGPILLIAVFLGLLIAYSFRLIYLLILAFVIMFIGKMVNKNLRYSESFKIGIYAITLGLLAELLVGITSIFTHFHGFPFMLTLITIGVVFANLKNPPSTKVAKSD